MLLWDQLLFFKGLGCHLVLSWDCGVGNQLQRSGFEAATIEIYIPCAVYHVFSGLAAEKRMDQADSYV